MTVDKGILNPSGVIQLGGYVVVVELDNRRGM